MRRILLFSGVALLLGGFAGCEKAAQPALSYAIFAEYAKDRNVLMKDGLNRRVFNTTEAQVGPKITLNADGSITLQPGRYRLSGFSIVTMQDKLTTPLAKNSNYPGYCLVYPKDYEANNPLQHQLGIGSPSAALDMGPSVFDAVYTCERATQICLGHQSGDALHNEVFLSVYDVDGITSPFHVFARMSVFEF